MITPLSYYFNNSIFLFFQKGVPAFQIFPGDRKIHERENVTFPCFPTGEPTPSVTWKFKDVTIDPVNSNKYFIGLFGDQNYGSLTIYNLEFADNGEYTCVISNEHGSNDDSATLEIQGINIIYIIYIFKLYIIILHYLYVNIFICYIIMWSDVQ